MVFLQLPWWTTIFFIRLQSISSPQSKTLCPETGHVSFPTHPTEEWSEIWYLCICIHGRLGCVLGCLFGGDFFFFMCSCLVHEWKFRQTWHLKETKGTGKGSSLVSLKALTGEGSLWAVSGQVPNRNGLGTSLMWKGAHLTIVEPQKVQSLLCFFFLPVLWHFLRRHSQVLIKCQLNALRWHCVQLPCFGDECGTLLSVSERLLFAASLNGNCFSNHFYDCSILKVILAIHLQNNG